ncbi:MAG: glycosyl hydrolase [Kiritimatiellia bacterium]
MRLRTVVVLAALAALCARAAPDPQTVFAHPPRRAKTGVWWHWMGCNVTRAGIVRDLDWFAEVGIGSATIFGLADVCTPWATPVGNSPTRGLVAFTPAWWKLVRFACEEAAKRGIELGIHNCPGYTSTGGPWIPPRLAMRELVFNVTNAAEQISLAAHAAFPVYDEAKGRFGKPDIPSRRTDLREIAVVGGVRIAHIPMGAFTQPNQWAAFGLECDKMNPEAVAFHLDHVIADLKTFVGDQIGKGLTFVLLDSYEAGRPTWTPRMREEFQARRGYDPLPLLPVLGGFKVADAATERKFRADYERTIKDLYRDVLFRTMREKLAAAGLEFACEPYTGPFDSRECAAHVDRVMTEFWFDPRLNRGVPGELGWNRWTGPGGVRHRVVEAEAFTGQPAHCQWTETPLQLKACGDWQFARGVNRFTLHTCPLQPWDESVRPGMTMGRWGAHFGRTQTWAKTGKGWFAYLNRCQALLQWGEPCAERLSCTGIRPAGTPVSSVARAADGKRVFFVANHSDHPVALSMALPAGCALAPEWFDPVTGRITPLAVEAGGAPIRLPACGSGFLVLRKPAAAAVPSLDGIYLQTVEKPFAGAAMPETACAFTGAWTVAFDAATTVEMETLLDWTRHDNPAVKYFSGTATYRRAFGVAGDGFPSLLTLGDCNGQVARVRINGVDLGTAWCEPYEVRIPAGVVRAGTNVLEIEFTNVWANRLIGDEQEPADCDFAAAPYPGGSYLTAFPDWFVAKTPRPSSGRRCFTNWNYFTRNSPLVPSGLLGPVRFHRLEDRIAGRARGKDRP